VTLSFRLTLSGREWDSRVGGWRCEALAIPGAKLQQLCDNGTEVGTSDYQIENGVIVWNKKERPAEIVAAVEIDKDLQAIQDANSALAADKAGLEEQKFALEQHKFKSDRFWKALSTIGAVLGVTIGYAYKYYLEPASTTTGAPAIASFDRSNDFLSSNSQQSFRSLLKVANREAWFVGTSFYISTDQFRDELIEKARTGFDLNFLVFDPASPAAKTVAQLLDIPVESVVEQCVTGLRSLQVIRKALLTSGSTGQVRVRLSQIPFSSRLYFFDPKITSGSIYVIPQVSSVSSQNSPGFLVRNDKAPFSSVFFDGIGRLWNGSFVTELDAWLRAHPEYGI